MYIYNSMNVCKWCMSGSATENSILLNVLLRLNKLFNQSIKIPFILPMIYCSFTIQINITY